MASTIKELERELPGRVRVYKDGSVERLRGSPTVPPSLDDPETGVSSKDITISQNPIITARFYLPKLQPNQNEKLPILAYFHGGAFCLESAFSFLSHRYLNLLVSQSNVIAISVEYRLAPEHPLPAAYEDSWAALQWIASHSTKNPPINTEPWLVNHANLNKLYIGGDSAGANIVHNLAIQAGVDGLINSVKISKAFLGHPYFWGSKPIGSEPIQGHEKSQQASVWNFVYPSASGGVDNPMLNPTVAEAPSLARIECRRMLVYVAGKDDMRERGVWYYNAVRESGWEGEMELFEMEEEVHCFHVFHIETENAKIMIKRLVCFLLE